MIRCLAIDDEPLALEQLKAYIKKIPYLTLEDSCMSALSASKVLAEKQIDAIFIDINMPDLNGMDFVKSLFNPPLVVFTTAYSEYAIEGFKVNAVDYLLKPFGLDDFQRAANKVLRQYQLLHQQEASATMAATATPPTTDEGNNVLFVKSEYRMVRIDIARIRYVEAMSEYLRLHLEDESKPVIALLSMKKLEERLPSNFIRVHRSYIVNVQKIQHIERGRIVMNKETYIPISEGYKDVFNQFLSEKSLEK
ncbi:MAG: LytTR family DNA-binding domain-containing protein [Bacteroidaceae bacterium]|nr:LytTR family DNA-binding domain-containing protein [Bacteroidaceae bacterium]